MMDDLDASAMLNITSLYVNDSLIENLDLRENNLLEKVYCSDN